MHHYMQAQRQTSFWVLCKWMGSQHHDQWKIWFTFTNLF